MIRNFACHSPRLEPRPAASCWICSCQKQPRWWTSSTGTIVNTLVLCKCKTYSFSCELSLFNNLFCKQCFYFGDEEINKSCIIEVQAVWTNKIPRSCYWTLPSSESCQVENLQSIWSKIWGEFAPNVAWKQSLLRSLPSEEPHKYCFRLWLFVCCCCFCFFFHPLSFLLAFFLSFFLAFQGLDDQIVDNVVADGAPKERSEASLEC